MMPVLAANYTQRPAVTYKPNEKYIKTKKNNQTGIKIAKKYNTKLKPWSSLRIYKNLVRKTPFDYIRVRGREFRFGRIFGQDCTTHWTDDTTFSAMDNIILVTHEWTPLLLLYHLHCTFSVIIHENYYSVFYILHATRVDVDAARVVLHEMTRHPRYSMILAREAWQARGARA